jgi:hypothetical protein
VHLDRDGVLAQRLDRVGELDLALVDLEALGEERLGDVGRRDRSESVSFSPTRRAISTSVWVTRWPSASACILSSASRASAAARSRSICRRLFALTARASLRGSR